MKIAIDFDGVICNGTGINRSHDPFDYKPKKDAVEAIDWLIEQGHEIWIFTVRPEPEWETIWDWCDKYGIRMMKITNTKLQADIYLDDRAIRFTNWQDFCKLLG